MVVADELLASLAGIFEAISDACEAILLLNDPSITPTTAAPMIAIAKRTRVKNDVESAFSLLKILKLIALLQKHPW
jgi:hypothetical protein